MCDCICGETDDLNGCRLLDDDELLAFERRMIAGGEKTYLDCLLETGMRIPPPEELDDGALHAKLWEVIRGLARLRVFLESTDHLPDRTLYERLYRGVLREVEWVVHIGTYDLRIDMTDGFGTNDPVEMWLRYYADEESRRGLLEEEPDYPMPPRERPAFDRDRHLPQPREEEIDVVA